MKVKVGITHNCELLAKELPEEQINYYKYLRLEAELFKILEPCPDEEFDAPSLQDKIDSVLDPCHKERSKVVYVEFLSSPHVTPNSTIKITDNQFEEYRIKLPTDGLYVYYKLMIYKENSLNDDQKKRIYYNENDKKLYYNKKEILDIETLLVYLDYTGSTLDFYEEPVFSLCKLEHCVFNLQRKSLLPIIKFCGRNTCEENKLEKDQRTFLFISLQVLQHLISEEKYAEAEEILESLSSCNSLCKDLNTNSNCGCG